MLQNIKRPHFLFFQRGKPALLFPKDFFLFFFSFVCFHNLLRNLFDFICSCKSSSSSLFSFFFIFLFFSSGPILVNHFFHQVPSLQNSPDFFFSLNQYFTIILPLSGVLSFESFISSRFLACI